MSRRVFNDLQAALREAIDHAQGRRKLTTWTVRLPQPVEVSPKDIVRLRRSLGVSQGVLASMLGVKRVSVAAWEQGVRTPQGPARRLLELLGQHPGLAKELLRTG